MWSVVASAEQWLCVLLTAVSGAAGAGGGQTGNCISHPRPETSPGHQISPPVGPSPPLRYTLTTTADMSAGFREIA